MKLRFAAPRALVDINRIPGLDTLAENGGASHRRPRAPQDLRALGAPARPLRHARRRGAADLRPDRPQPRHRLRLARARRPAGRLGLGRCSRSTPRWSRGARAGRARSPSRELFQGPFMTSLEPTEIDHRGARARPGPARGRHLPQARAQGRRLRHRRRRGAPSSLAERQRRRAGIALTGVGATNLGPPPPRTRSPARSSTDEAIAERGRLAAEAAQPYDDIRGSAEYKRNVVRVFTERGLRTAADVARAA